MNFDYIVVGAGSAGCALAARLSADPAVSVALVEAGGTDDSAFIRAPLGFALGGRLPLHAVHYRTEPQPGLGGRRGFQPRGRVLGGSSAVNAMIYCRGNRADYDGWAALGNPGWDYASVLELFKRAEDSACFGANTWHGTGGPLGVDWPRTRFASIEAFLAACESQGLARTADYNGAEQEGCQRAQVTQRNGERCSAAHAYLAPHRTRASLTILSHASALRITFEGQRASGLVIARGGREETLGARREVILSCGAYGSPQLLMCSGLGPAAALRALGIPVRADLPGVGRNLQDHITASLNWRSPRGPAAGFGISFRGALHILRGIGEWRRTRSGPLTSNVAEALAFLRTQPTLAAPDIELELVTAMVEDHARKLRLGHGYGVHVTLLTPESRGELRLASADARDAPLIDPRYFSAPADMPRLVEGVRRALAIMQAPPLAALRGPMLVPLTADDPAGIEREIRRSADTEYHPVGTCRMGPADDPLAVVDASLRVRGITGLRVADASIMPTITRGNTNAPTIMIGEKCADLVHATASLTTHGAHA